MSRDKKKPLKIKLSKQLHYAPCDCFFCSFGSSLAGMLNLSCIVAFWWQLYISIIWRFDFNVIMKQRKKTNNFQSNTTQTIEFHEMEGLLPQPPSTAFLSVLLSISFLQTSQSAKLTQRFLSRCYLCFAKHRLYILWCTCGSTCLLG